jgi:hypothetical protein
VVARGDNAGGAERRGGTQDRAHIVWISDLVEQHECRFRPGFGKGCVEIGLRQRQHFCSQPLVDSLLAQIPGEILAAGAFNQHALAQSGLAGGDRFFCLPLCFRGDEQADHTTAVIAESGSYGMSPVHPIAPIRCRGLAQRNR